MATSLTNTGITFPDATTQTTAATAEFSSGTVMLFTQTSAPTGWTKSTTHNNKALRVVTGTASSGGSVTFTTAFASGLSANSTTLTTSQIPSHNHGGATASGGTHSGHSGAVNGGGHAGSGWYQGGNQFGLANSGASHTHTISSQGGGGSHTHSLPSFDVQYVDVIIATKD